MLPRHEVAAFAYYSCLALQYCCTGTLEVTTILPRLIVVVESFLADLSTGTRHIKTTQIHPIFLCVFGLVILHPKSKYTLFVGRIELCYIVALFGVNTIFNCCCTVLDSQPRSRRQRNGFIQKIYRSVSVFSLGSIACVHRDLCVIQSWGDQQSCMSGFTYLHLLGR